MVELGDAVTRGQTLAQLEVRDFELGVQRAEAQLAEACATIGLELDGQIDELDPEEIPFVAVERATWDEAKEALARLERLQRSNSVSESEYRRQLALERVARAKYDSALRNVEVNKALIESRRVQLAQAKQSLTDATIVAPFDGVVQERMLAEGGFVQSGTPLFTVVRVDPLRFRGRVPERKAIAVKAGQRIRISIEGIAAEIEAEVKRVSPSLDLASRSLQIEADVPNPGGLRSGLYAEAMVDVDPEATTTAIPVSAMGEFAGVYKVWLIRGNEIVSQRVSPERTNEQMVEISDGLVEEDVVLAEFTVGETARREAGQKAADAGAKPSEAKH